MVIFLALFYVQITDAVEAIDDAVSLKSKTINMIKNVDSILNRTATIAEIANRIGGVTLSAAVDTRPFMQQILNTTTDTLQDLHHLIQKPTIHIGGR